MTFALGALPDKPDARDFPFAQSRLAKLEALPDAALFDPATVTPPVRDQQTIGSCVAMATCAVREILYRRMAPDTSIRPSPLHLYYEARKLIGTEGIDSGSTMRDAFKALNNIGVASEATWPYDVTRFTERPPDAAYKEALRYRIYVYRRLVTVQEVKACIAQGYPCAVVLFLYRNFYDLGPVAGPFLFIAPGSLVGAHAVTFIGYQKMAGITPAEQTFYLAQNSWGTQWGHQGFFWVSEEYLQANMGDAWMAEA